MANEIRVQSSLQIDNGNLHEATRPTGFVASMTGSRGPTPGVLTATKAGVDVSFTQLASLGGFCKITNLDSSGFITVGIWDTVTLRFYGLMDILAGEWVIFRLSTYLGEELGTGTHVASSAANMRIKTNNVSSAVKVEAYDA